MLFFLVLSHISGFYFIVWFHVLFSFNIFLLNERRRRRICFFPPSFDCDFNFFLFILFVRPVELYGGTRRRDGFAKIFGPVSGCIIFNWKFLWKMRLLAKKATTKHHDDEKKGTSMSKAEQKIALTCIKIFFRWFRVDFPNRNERTILPKNKLAINGFLIEFELSESICLVTSRDSQNQWSSSKIFNLLSKDSLKNNKSYQDTKNFRLIAKLVVKQHELLWIWK